jgi:hypothetical protein
MGDAPRAGVHDAPDRSVIAALAYVADAWVLGTYALMARSGRTRPFHLANAVGFAPLLASEIVAHVYPPLVLTLAFGVLGWVGLWKERSR